MTSIKDRLAPKRSIKMKLKKPHYKCAYTYVEHVHIPGQSADWLHLRFRCKECGLEGTIREDLWYEIMTGKDSLLGYGF